MPHWPIVICAYLLLLYVVVRIVGANRRRNREEAMSIFSYTEPFPMDKEMGIAQVNFDDDNWSDQLIAAFAEKDAELPPTHAYTFDRTEGNLRLINDGEVWYGAIPCNQCGEVDAHPNHTALSPTEYLASKGVTS